MKDLNVIVIAGRLVRDMELSYTTGGCAIGKFSIASNRSVKSGDKWEDEASYFNCDLIGKRAESLKQYMLKGSQVVVIGELRQQTWEKDGNKHSSISIYVEDVQLFGGKSKSTNKFEKAVDIVADAFGGTVSEEFPNDIPF